MISVEYCQLFARYNRWMNERLFAAAGELDDAERKRDRQAFFGSLHRTLNHLVWADRTWLGRFTAQEYAVAAYGANLFDDFETLARERELTDTRILGYCGALTTDALAATLAYRNSAGGARRAPLWIAISHYFNHQTNHRAQALTLLTQMGKDVGPTDLMALPGVVRVDD